MKKSVYELEKTESDKYLEEFNKTEFAKKSIKNQKNASYFIIFAIVLFFAIYIIDIISSDDGEMTQNALYDLPDFIFIIGILLYAYYYVLRKIGFYRWLKIKHDIEY